MSYSDETGGAEPDDGLSPEVRNALNLERRKEWQRQELEKWRARPTAVGKAWYWGAFCVVLVAFSCLAVLRGDHGDIGDGAIAAFGVFGAFWYRNKPDTDAGMRREARAGLLWMMIAAPAFWFIGRLGQRLLERVLLEPGFAVGSILGVLAVLVPCMLLSYYLRSRASRWP